MYVVLQFGRFNDKILNLDLIDGGIKSHALDKNYNK